MTVITMLPFANRQYSVYPNITTHTFQTTTPHSRPPIFVSTQTIHITFQVLLINTKNYQEPDECRVSARLISTFKTLHTHIMIHNPILRVRKTKSAKLANLGCRGSPPLLLLKSNGFQF